MWTEPKTDWHCETVNGEYKGDYFNAEDYNRIKNNVMYLCELEKILHNEFLYKDLGADKTYNDDLYADEISDIIESIKKLREYSHFHMWFDFNPYRFRENKPMLKADELNKIESTILEAYKTINDEFIYTRKFTWNFEEKGEV